MPYGLSPRTQKTLTSIFEKYPGIQKVILYGSRALGSYRPGSDIDITLCTGPAFTLSDLLRLMGDFDESDMPYLVDVSLYQNLTNPELKAHIDSAGKILYSRTAAFEGKPVESV
ncbi:MAG: nucleotidyltransferase domain-containing protein [Spirochaetales bacterium]|jgi:predicted nucleotidyltransferase|nr:nucleotidyltransferase domain-containing protein [Spirochaetales bacterium]